MKAFIVAAMLVAAVAGQSFNMFNKFDQDKSIMMNKFYGQKMGYPVVDKYTTDFYGQKDLVNLPSYLQDSLVSKQVLTIDELYNTELFREYLTLPLFKQMIQVPMFQKFVQSIYYQKFWTIPAFKQYFVDPVLFYKYVYPMVQLFKYDTTTTFEQTQIENKNVLPFVSGYERDMYVPTVYNKDFLLQDGLYYKNLLEKIYSQLYNVDETTMYNKIVDPITGELKTLPTTFQGVDTIFGQDLVKDILLKKFFLNNNKIDLESILGDKLITDLIMKKNVDTDLIKKIILSKNVNTIDTTVFGLNKDLLLSKNVDVELLKNLLFKKNFDIELVKMIVLNKILGDDTVIPQEYLLKEKMMMNKINPIVARMMINKMNALPTTYDKMMEIPTTYNKFEIPTYNKMEIPTTTFDKTFDNLDIMKKMNIFDILNKKDLIYNNQFDKINMMNNVFGILSKKDLAINDKITLNKILADKINEIDNFGTYETVYPKMVDDVTKFERVPLTLDAVKPMMGVRTFDKKVIPEMIKA